MGRLRFRAKLYLTKRIGVPGYRFREWKEEFPYGRIYLVLEGSMLIKILFSDRVTHNFPERPSRGEGEDKGLGRLPQLRQGGKML